MSSQFPDRVRFAWGMRQWMHQQELNKTAADLARVGFHGPALAEEGTHFDEAYQCGYIAAKNGATNADTAWAELQATEQEARNHRRTIRNARAPMFEKIA